VLKLWRNQTARSIFYQAAVIGGIAWFFYAAIGNALSNLQHRGVSTGLSFLKNEAGISIPETPRVPSDIRWLALVPVMLLVYFGTQAVTAGFRRHTAARIYTDRALAGAVLAAVVLAAFNIEWVRYSPSDPYYLILVTGMANSICVGAVALVGAVSLGFVFGVCQLSTNWLLRKIVMLITETARNVPLLLHVLFWYGLILNTFPPVRGGINIGSAVFLTNRGIFYPSIEAFDLTSFAYLAIACAAVALISFKRTSSPKVILSGFLIALLVCAGLSAAWQVPVLRGFNFAQGTSVTPEFLALLVGLVVYYSAFIADIVRSAIRSIPIGQWEGAKSLGLSRSKTIGLIVIPQAMRVIVPPLSNQVLGLAKDTSIGVAVAYSELVSISRTVINQTGQALEVMFLVMIFYLVINLSISSGMNLYNQRVRISEQ
jgi:general L-amino acid transport system permease protein